MPQQPEQYSTDLGLSTFPEISKDKYPDVFNDLISIRLAIRTLQTALDRYTGALGEDPNYWANATPNQFVLLQNISRVYCQANANITYGQMVHFTNTAGTLRAELSDATDITKPARAFCSIIGGILSGNFGEFILIGINSAYVGLTPGLEYYAAIVPGSLTSVIPVTTGNLIQKVGYALSPTQLYHHPSLDYTAAP